VAAVVLRLWAFRAPRRDGDAFLASKFDLIPADTDIMVGHGRRTDKATGRADRAVMRTSARRQ
jgi:hypothetical protein